VDVRVELKGPLFQRGRAAAVLRQAAQNTVEELIQRGEERLNEMLRPRPTGVFLSVAEARPGKASKGHYRRNVMRSVKVRNLHGSIDGGNVVYGPWLEGVSHRNQVTRFKGYASFRRVGQHLERRAQPTLEKWVKRAMKELG
jgi:hypothetical protein